MVSTNYAEVIPVLLKHLMLPYSDKIREGIARSLAVPEPEVIKAWPLLVEEFRKAPIGWGIKLKGDTEKLKLGAKDGLACALSATVTEDTLEELIALLKDPAHGESRILLLSPLRKRRKKNPRVRQVLEELATDPDLAKSIATWKKL